MNARTLSRRDEAGAPSARGLLLTLLGEFVLPADGAAWTSAVLEVFARLGVEEKATRQALMRSATAGWLTAEKNGRRTRWRLTSAARRMLTEGADRIYGFMDPGAKWDGRWLLISLRVPEADRRARHVVRTRLAWAGFGSLGPGLWISPHPDRETEASTVLREAGAAAEAHMFVATRADLGDVRAMVASAWDLDGIQQRYEEFIAAFPGDPGDVLRAQIELVHAWRRFPSIDPVLPRELLPPHWSGLRAALLFAERRAAWSPGARAEWDRLNAESSTGD